MKYKTFLSEIIKSAKQYGLLQTIRALITKIRGGSFHDAFLSVSNSANVGQIIYNKRGNRLIKKQQNICQKLHCLTNRHKLKSVKMSIVMPIYNPPMKWFKKALSSIRRQYHKSWELLLIDDGSFSLSHVKYIQKIVKKDRHKRIKYIQLQSNNGISTASNYGIQNAIYEYIVLMDQDDIIMPNALYCVAECIKNNNNVDFIYTDECKISTKGKFYDFYIKPNWSPALLYNQMYTGHLTVYKKNLLVKTGFFRKEYDLAQDFDLAVRVSKVANNIVHINKILYCWRSIPGSSATDSNSKRVLEQQNLCKRIIQNINLGFKIPGKIKAISQFNYFFQSTTDFTTKCSIILFVNDANRTKKILEALKKNNSVVYKIIFVRKNPNIVLDIKYPNFNINSFIFSSNLNFDIAKSNNYKNSDYFICMDDDITNFNQNWVNILSNPIFLPNVSIVSPLIIDGDDKIVNGGLFISSKSNIVKTLFYKTDLNYNEGIFNHFLIRNISIFDPKCFLFKKELLQNNILDLSNINTFNVSRVILKKGGQIIFNPKAVIHIDNNSNVDYNKAKIKYKDEYITQEQEYMYETIK